MVDETNGDGQQRNQLSRTSILVAAARAFGSRDPDEGVRNPDFLADRLIGPDELELIDEHPLSKGLKQDYSEASRNPAIAMLVNLMILRTRFIDEALRRAVTRGVTQIVILGAGFDSRAYRFQDLLSKCRIFEVDARPTQEYKRGRIHAVLGSIPSNVSYLSVDFAKDSVSDALKREGFEKGAQTFYIWEGVSMYLPEKSVRGMLQMVASHSAPGSSIVLDYANRLGIEMAQQNLRGPVGMAASWGEPWIFGVPGANGDQFFRALGFDPGVPLSMNDREVIKRFAVRRDGTTYAAHAIEAIQAERKTQTPPQSEVTSSPKALDIQRAIAATGGVYWLAELTISSASD